MDLFIPSQLKDKVAEWRERNYPCDFPVIAEILGYNLIEAESGTKQLRYLRKAQFEALETYWYLRLVEKTPHIFELYRRLYGKPADLFKALGIKLSSDDLMELMSQGGTDSVFESIRTRDAFVKRYKLETVRESLTLAYPSYILALAMGSGKTVLIGAIIATEFSMALEYPNGFVKNAVVFAPGKTILGALKELSDVRYSDILPPRLSKQFMSSLKITYTKDEEKDIPIIRGSSFNIIVTNTEKIRIQKSTSRIQTRLTSLRAEEKQQEQQETANLRLQSIASLPNLAIFSDEAHHTYGLALDKELKKVRKTVDYLADNTNVIVVVNTTGTPYFKKKMLPDVVFWYGLSQGIKDGILKEVKDSVISFEDVAPEEFVRKVLEDFVRDYRHVSLGDGSRAKLAIYFPQTNHLRSAKPIIERRAKELGLDPSVVLEVHNKSAAGVKDLFNNRMNEPANPYRVFLLVNMGTEGWNCPSLFATALARKLKASNNFVLQAASRCLRQVPGNVRKARIYLSKDNVGILDSQLNETFGETLQVLDKTKQEVRSETIVLRKTNIPPILVRKKVARVVPVVGSGSPPIKITPLQASHLKGRRTIYDVRQRSSGRALTAKKTTSVSLSEEFEDIYSVAVELSTIYRLDLTQVYDILRAAYSSGEIPLEHVGKLRDQLESQLRGYEITEETVEIALALVKLEGFEKVERNGSTIYTAEITYHIDKEDLVLHYEKVPGMRAKELTFHYTPYNMDSHPEKDLFLWLIEALDENPDEIEEIYFTGALTTSNKTDLLFEYKDKKGKWRTYTPDFIIKKKDGRILIVEAKAEVYMSESKEIAIKELVDMNPDKLKYELLLTKTDEIGLENRKRVEKWIYGDGK